MTSIPASQLVNVVPSVLGAGGNPLSLNGVFLTDDTSIPLGTVASFATLADVQAWFGASSLEAQLAAVYFGGFSNATLVPGLIYFAQYNTAAASGYVRGGALTGVTLSAIQALTGVLTLSIDGGSETTGSIDLSGATSFSNAAAIIQTALNTEVPGTTCSYDSQRNAFKITSPTTGASSAIGFPTANALSSGLKLTAAAGAVASAGAAIAVPATFMAALVLVTQNWATFLTTFEPVTATKVLFADWVTQQNDRYAYVAWDTDTGPIAGVDPDSFGALTADYDGVIPVWGTSDKAAFVSGYVAALNFGETNGRATLAFRGQAGLTADVTNATVANNLKANGYNFYASYATANDQFVNMQPGQISGEWDWVDTFVNQIYLNNQLQLAFMTLLTQVKSVPYNQQGFNMLRQAALDPINEALNFGSIRTGVALSASQAVQVNTAAGASISNTLQTQGWFLKVADPGAVVRGQRGSPAMTLWYMDGGSVQSINLASISVE